MSGNEVKLENVDTTQMKWYAYWIDGRNEPYYSAVPKEASEETVAIIFRGAKRYTQIR